ncbi:hypothetical protein ASD99_15260 [Mesorhizobium sp. Root695]|nr:hypothetical protein ASD99_15260 [Mesorhizobium sp. Root695]
MRSPAHWLSETKNPPVRRVTGANQHHEPTCTIAEVMESRKNSYREKLAAQQPPTPPNWLSTKSLSEKQVDG